MINFFIISLFITYFLGMYQIFSIGTYGVTPYDILAALLFIYILKRLAWDGDKLMVKSHGAVYGLIVLIFGALISGITPLFYECSNVLLTQYLKTLSHFLFYISFAVLCLLYPISYRAWFKGLKLWMILGLFINIFAIYQLIARAYDLPLAWLSFNNVSMTVRDSVGIQVEDMTQLSLKYENFFRATSIFYEPSALAGFNIYLIIMFVVPYLQFRKPLIKSRLFNVLSITFCVLATFLTFSITAVVGLFLVFGSVFIFNRTARIIKFLKYFAVAIALIIATDGLVDTYLGTSVLNLFSIRLASLVYIGSESRVTTDGDSMDDRANKAKLGLIIWKSSPVIGIGLGLTGHNKMVNMQFSDYSVMTTLSEMGIIGFTGFNIMFIYLFIETRRFLRPGFRPENITEENRTILGILFYIMVTLFELNYLSGNSLVSPPLWLPIGMMFSLINSYYISQGRELYEISLVSSPLKEKFNKFLGLYIDRNSAH